jgi:hypothetical protein
LLSFLEEGLDVELNSADRRFINFVLMDHHESQKQHRVPQVYLKQFGFEKDKIWYVTIFNPTKNYTEDVPIKEFNYAINEFDLPSDDYNEKKAF